MRRIIFAFVAIFCVAIVSLRANAGQYAGPGNYVGTPSSQVTAAFAAFPNGGQGLTDAIRELLLANPNLADDVAFVAGNGNPAQQLAAANGMAQAVTTFLARGDSNAGGEIVRAATLSGNTTVALIVSNAVASNNGGSNLYSGGPNSNPVTTSCTTVSPTTPGGAC
jgi:hypothetical protein